MRSVLLAVLTLISLLAAPLAALASPCQAFVNAWPGRQYADLGPLAQAAPEVVIEYIAHSSFRLRTTDDVVIVTDYFGASGPGRVPDVVTMNHAHSTHFTDYPDPAIPYVLRGWKTGGQAEHYLQLRDVLVRNVPTDLRSFGFEANGNSIFIFEVGDLCIGHLGHLHHEPSEQHYAAIGRLDVVMAPVDGTFTLNLGQMINVLKRIKARIVLPMHAFGPGSLERFLAGMKDDFEIRVEPTDMLRVSSESLPTRPTVVVLPNRFSTFSPLDD